MSFQYYNTWWIKSKQNLEDLFQRDESIRKTFKPINDRNSANSLIGGMYARYSVVVQTLCTCLDQLAQPQKHVAMKKLVDAACVRLNEFNDQLRQISLSEYHYIDGSLVELKLVPYDVEILHPCLFHHRDIDVEDFIRRIQKGERIYIPPEPTVVISETEVEDQSKEDLTEVPAKSKQQVAFSSEQNESEEQKPEGKSPARKSAMKMRMSKETLGQPALTPQQLEELAKKEELKRALIVIQTAERGRQERIYFFDKSLTIRQRKALEKQPGGKAKQAQQKPADTTEQSKAATAIQRTWRGYSDRQLMKLREKQRRLLIGMTQHSWKSTKDQEVYETNLEQRRSLGEQRLREYIETMETEKARILRVVAPGLLEDIEDEIREWFKEWYVGARTFDNYPPEEKGGTILVVRGETMTPQEYLDDYEKKLKEKKKAGGQEALKAKKEKEKKLQQEAEKKKKEEEKKKKEAEKKKKKKKPGEFELEYEPTLSNNLKEAGEEDFRTVWNDRNDLDNPQEKCYMDLITEEFCYQTQLEMRKQADELMRLELDLLQEALANDKGKKYKKKKEKKKKGKKKGKKDPTGDRSLEELFQELVDNGVIRTYPRTRLDQFFGDFSYKNAELRAQDFDPPGAVLDVRQAVTLNCIQPLGVETMKKPKSVLIVGPPQCGLHLLANAVFNHTRCVLFDLTPEVTADIYPGTKGLTMLIHLVSKMSKLLQPSVIYLGQAERLFYKKVPKEEKDLDPKRVGNKLVKGIIKAIKADDRVLVLGVSNAPWLGQAGKMKKAFDRALLIPRPDYGSVYEWWRELLRPYHGVDRDFNITCLASVTMYQPYTVIRDAVQKVLTPRRLIQLSYKPLRAQELHEVFVSNQIEPITDKEWKKYEKWYKKTPLGKERAKFNKWADAKRELEKQQQEKQKAKK